MVPSELDANLRLAASFAARATEQHGRLAAALQALARRAARLSRGEEEDPGHVWTCYGAAEALLAGLRGDLDGVGAHLGQLKLRVEPEGEGPGPLAEALREPR